MTDTLAAPEVAARLGLGLRQTRAAIRRGDIPAIHLGGRWLVPVAAFEAWLASADGWQSRRPVTTAAELTKARQRRRAARRQSEQPQTYAQRLFARQRQ